MRLTKAMLDAIQTVLVEYLAGEGPQTGMSSKEIDAFMNNVDRASDWAALQIRKRKEKTTATAKKDQ